jgi:Flp pilus assembly protein TadG
VGTRRQIPNRTRTNSRGAVSIQLVVILVPVLFGFIGFAYDLGRLYSIRGELNQAANAMALAAAAKLNGTEAALDRASTAAAGTLADGNGNGNPYDFSHVFLNTGTAFLTSTAGAPSYFAAASDALSATGGSGTADGTTAQYAQANITADAPLTFWALLSGGQSRKTTIAASAVAGVSAPLCMACGTDIIAIAAASLTDPVDFGFTRQTHYTLGYSCTGAGAAPLTGDTALLTYVLINRYDLTSGISELNQLFNIGGNGLGPSTDPTQGCMTANVGTDLLWASATPVACRAASPNASVEAMTCGLTTRLDSNAAISTYATACSGAGDLTQITTPYTVDTDVTAYDDYTQYAGDNRRILTVAIVDSLTTTTTATMNIEGFRQFLLEPTSGLTSNNPSDPQGRFSVLYIGYPVPLKQGRFDGASCSLTNGPGKVVLFQ